MRLDLPCLMYWVWVSHISAPSHALTLTPIMHNSWGSYRGHGGWAPNMLKWCLNNDHHIAFRLKNNYDPQRRLLWSTKSTLDPWGQAPCLERRLRTRAHVAPFQWTREVCMATLTTLYQAIVNTSTFGVQRSMKDSTTIEELVVSKFAWVGCKSL